MKTNMKAAMQYQNKTPEEIAHPYKKRLRAKQGLIILIFLLYVIPPHWRLSGQSWERVKKNDKEDLKYEMRIWTEGGAQA